MSPRRPAAPAPLVPSQVVQLMRSVEFPEFNSEPAAGQPYGTPLTPRCDTFGLQYARLVPLHNNSFINEGAADIQIVAGVPGVKHVLNSIMCNLSAEGVAQALNMEISIRTGGITGTAIYEFHMGAALLGTADKFAISGLNIDANVGDALGLTYTGALGAGNELIVTVTWYDV